MSAKTGYNDDDDGDDDNNDHHGKQSEELMDNYNNDDEEAFIRPTFEACGVELAGTAASAHQHSGAWSFGQRGKSMGIDTGFSINNPARTSEECEEGSGLFFFLFFFFFFCKEFFLFLFFFF